ncbi:aminodeoxychorismate synthase component I [Arcobacter sp. CECT 8985]|uniref:aminodeoxychorismate synthase component I n=1 Tax=Arcobacter sp. CECT 8985 TaxID=1935424 RepID=UPI00100A85DC|nr:aminodeoxychorismate synthase component I [Arcobacter sp. CECT 8985]RXJ87748.1 aminodeoxychorismate synthase component I [Arcobacter sp. CECT 8985]
MNKKENIRKLLNKNGSSKEPFFFMVSYDLNKYEIFKLKDLPSYINFEISQSVSSNSSNTSLLKKNPIDFQTYKKEFDILQNNIKEGNSYLLNLTFQTKIQTPLSLEEIYKKANARFKLKYKNSFVCFSPEKFVEIKNNNIYTYPMKGTIDSTILNAKKKILSNEKEMAEHTMVVDLLRNDLSIVSSKVRVEKFRYCEEINAGEKRLIQVSSKIKGELNNNWKNHIGDIITELLPAGSITGTPKKKSVEILNEVENYKRDYYTGIAGIFDGENLYSFVLIRFIENINGELFYKSGGGITCDSDAKLEYQEIIDKIYIPS